MTAIAKKRLVIKSHSDEVLEEVKEYFRKYPNLPLNSDKTPVANPLEDQLNYLKRHIQK